MICVTGDIHGDIKRFNIPYMKKICGKDYPPSQIIILGDFGLIWTAKTPEETYDLNCLDSKPWETLTIIGNHENYERIYSKPLVEKYGAPMYQISKKVFAFQHGNVYTIEGKKFFIFGGAASIDKQIRTNRVTWWEEEIPTGADLRRGLETLEKHKDIDYVFTHTSPREAIDIMYGIEQRGFVFGVDLAKFDDPTVKMLDAFHDLISKEIPWYFGHFHMNKSMMGKSGRNYFAMYEDIIIL